MSIKRTLILIVFVMIAFTLTVSAIGYDSGATPSYITQGGEDFDYYFEDAYWRLREYEELGWEKAWTLTLVPNRNRSYGIWKTDNYIAWDYVEARFSNDYRWQNTDLKGI